MCTPLRAMIASMHDNDSMPLRARASDKDGMPLQIPLAIV